MAPWHIAVASIISAILGGLLGSGGVLAWFKLGPERKKLSVDAQKVTSDIHSGIIRDLRDDYNRVNDDNTQLSMGLMAAEKATDDCEKQVASLQATLATLRAEIARHGRMAELSRRKAHLAFNALGNFELHVASLLDIMRDHVCKLEDVGKSGIQINPEMRPHRIRAGFQAEMNKLEQLEIDVVDTAIEDELPPK